MGKRQENQAAAQAAAPRCIASVDAGIDAAFAPAHVARRCLELGFDSLLLRGQAAHDHGVIAPAAPPRQAATATSSAAAKAQRGTLQRGTLVEQARALGLGVLVERRLDLFDGSEPLVAEQPHWFRPLRDRVDRLPDPRAAEPAPTLALARFDDPACCRALLEWWQQRLQELFASGVSGVLWNAPQQVDAKHWGALAQACRGSSPGTAFLAWTPGLPAGAVDALAGAGFDAVFSSLPWWDLEAGWWYEEHARLRRAGAVIAPLHDPADAPAATHWSLGLQRRLALAAACNDGVLVPVQAQDLQAPDAGADKQPADPGSTDQHPEAAGAARQHCLHAANTALRARAPAARRALRPLWRDGGCVNALLVEDGAQEQRVVLFNTDDDHVGRIGVATLLRAGSAGALAAEDSDQLLQTSACVALEPGEVRSLRAVPAAPVLQSRARGTVRDAAAAPRVAIANVQPQVDGGRYAPRRLVGEQVEVQADIFSDGHEHLGALVRWRAVDARSWQQAPMRQLGNDRWAAEIPLQRLGRHEFVVQAWRDRFGSIHAELEAKRAAGNLMRVDVDDAVALVEATLQRAKGTLATRLRALLRQLAPRDEDASAGDQGGNGIDANGMDRETARRAALLLDPESAELMAAAQERAFLAEGPLLRVDAERRAAAFSSWYELFPRSQGADPTRHGTFDDVIARLPGIAAMGFDVLYMPPIHPIGRSHRKGRNNSLHAGADEPGSPYAIGSAEGGHDAIHPQLGDLDDFHRLRAAAAGHGMELALDFAIQCSPDHPWLREHPDWFAWRADATLRYAENPPKKYQDIVNVEFYAPAAVPGLWLALRDVVLWWVQQGVALFRVDNPHTKPYAFWEWMIDEVRARHPDVVFLSEAFTRPRPMYHLAKLGFSQSYTYFTWRHGKQELIDWMRELSDGEPREFYRPHLFVNTPDINPFFLQRGGRPAHLIRAALATTLSGLWGMYSGFELCEATPLAAGKEEYLDSEKFQLRAWDWQRPGNIVAEISRLNLLRRLHPPLQSHLGVRFYHAGNDQVLYFGKRVPGARSMVLVAICLDPQHAHDTDFEVPLWEWGLPDHAAVDVEDLWHGQRMRWHGKVQHLRLDPHALPFALWRIQPSGSTGQQPAAREPA